MSWSSGRPVAWSAAIVALVSAAAFLPAVRGGFVDWDDVAFVVQNPFLGRGLGPLVSGAFGTFQADLWVPAVWLSFGADRALWGLDPAGYHVTNVLLHAANGGLVTLLAAALFRAGLPGGEEGKGPLRAAGPLLAGLLWALHPMRVESVAWISERKDVLSGAFGLASLLAFSVYARREEVPLPPRAALGRPSFRAGFLLFSASLLSKPSFVILPLLLLVLDFWPFRRDRAGFKPLVLEKSLLFVPAAVVAVVTAVAQRPALMPLAEASAVARVLNACRSIVVYAGLTLWPDGLQPFYFHPGNEARLSSPGFLLPVLAVCGATAAVLGLARRGVRAPMAFWSLFVLSLLPMLGLVQAGGQGMADRFTYLAAVVPAIFAGGAWSWTVARVARRGGTGPAIAAGASALLALAALAALLATTEKLIPVWRDDGALWTRIIDLHPEEYGKAYYFRARYLLRVGKLPEARADADACVRISRRKRYRRLWEVLGLRADILEGLGEREAAESDRAEAARMGPGSARGVKLSDSDGSVRSRGN